jgi:3,4-dihydroxy 2-butanone 4-phosphate synthase / GTP cyclohydrolase II
MISLDDATARFADTVPVLVAPERVGDPAFVATPAEGMTRARLEELSRIGGGMVLLALDEVVARRLGLEDAPRRGPAPGARRRAALRFALPIDAAHGVGDGWSVAERALTMRVAAAPGAVRDDVVVPGQVQPVRSERSALLDGGGAVPAALELAHRAGRPAAVALCAVVGGRAASLRVPRAGVAELRARAEADRAVACRLPTTHGELRAVAQRATAGGTMLALVHGDPATRARPLVSAHGACLLGDTLGSLLCDCRPRLDRALAGIVADGAGVVVYAKPGGGPRVACGRTTPADAPAVAGLLGALGIRTLRLGAGDPGLVPGLRDLGFDVEAA